MEWMMKLLHNIALAVGVGAVLLGTALSGVVRAENKFESLHVYPGEIKMNSAAAYQNIVAVAQRSDGVTVDVTEQVEWKLAEPTVAKIESFQLKPLADGQTKLIANWQGFTAETALTVTDAAKPRPISFAQDIMPVLTRTGCNTGSCHGAARGKDGFRMSLFGFDPQGDYQRITREIGVRRINLAIPDQSF
jgi:hypothetical protein